MIPAISVSGLCKSYGGAPAVRGVAFTVAPGEIFGLIGPNGAGKTTTLECLLGLCEPDAGDLRILGLDARRDPDSMKAVVGAQLQTSALPDPMTPREALRLFGAFYPEARPADELLGRFGLSAIADARYSHLSSGQRQRLALALAFINNPKVLVLDEPTAGLDVPARRELHAIIAEQRAAGRAVIFTTHYLEEARTLCDRIAFLDRGRILAVGAPEELIARSAARTRLVVRIEPTLEAAHLSALPSVRGCTPCGPGWSIETDSVNRTLSDLAALVDSRRGELADVQIRRPSLDDVFFELTRS